MIMIMIIMIIIILYGLYGDFDDLLCDSYDIILHLFFDFLKLIHHIICDLP